MYRIMLLNSKGGCGKTTIATNLASYYAAHGLPTVLIDHDAQGSSSRWLGARHQAFPGIHGIAAYKNPASVTRSWQLRLPMGTQRVIIDTPASVKGLQLAELVRRTDSIIIPVLSSHIDLDAVSKFIDELSKLPQMRARETRVAVVANRARERTLMFLDLERFLKNIPFPFIARLRDTQNYVRAGELGIGVHELPLSRVRRDCEQWVPLLAWLDAGIGGAQQSREPDRPGTRSAGPAAAAPARAGGITRGAGIPWSGPQPAPGR